MTTSRDAALLPGITLIDSHCHLDEERFAPDREAVITRAVAAGVTRMVTIGASGGNLHAPDEWVSLPELVAIGDILERTIADFCA